MKDTWAAARNAGLHLGDTFTQAEFHERYLLLGEQGGVELVEGVVYLPYYVEARVGQVRGQLLAWLSGFASESSLGCSGRATVLLDQENEVEPTALLFDPETAAISDGFITGSPRLVVEVAYNEHSLALHGKARAYASAEVEEYVIYLVETEELHWFSNDSGTWRRLQPGEDGVITSEAFPGLRLHPPSLVDRETA